MKIDLSKMKRKELEQLRADIDKELEQAAARDLKEARDKAAKIAAEHGFTLDELTGKASGRKGRQTSKAPAKYRNPKDPTQTWSGRGRRPKWIVDAEAKGQSLDKFLI
ncbi:H-NS family nucleoid-associated regulatory protein [Aestuariibius sp. 2305UL40-4]|uniref:H-NS histone family protein n=1 Tax=Aestuariibius violaceus TaxID=3234132 RepID=UPI00345E9605